MTETMLWVATLVWGTALLIPMIKKMWAKYVYWFYMNFGEGK